MPVYLVFAAQALIYLSAVPLCVAFQLSTRGGLRLGAGVGAFQRRFALGRARRAARPPGSKPQGRSGGLRLAAWLLRRLRADAFELRGSLCLGDAAATALGCGALRALAPALGSRARRVEIDVRPEFGGALSAQLQGMIVVHSGQIISAAAQGGIELISGRIAQWKSTLSKASWPPPWRASGT